MADLRLTISFTDEEDYIHAKGQDNSSEYIRTLVRKDRLKQDSSLEVKILKMLEQALGSRPIASIPISKSEKKQKALKNILNM